MRGKKEGSLFYDRPAERAAKLVLIKLRLGARRRAAVIGVQDFVAEEFVQIAVKVVGARLRHHVDDGPRVAAVFRIESIGQNAEFLNAIGRRLNLGRLAKRSLASPPFTLKLLERPRPPFTETAPGLSLP